MKVEKGYDYYSHIPFFIFESMNEALKKIKKMSFFCTQLLKSVAK